jgi:hypothetical protein
MWMGLSKEVVEGLIYHFTQCPWGLKSPAKVQVPTLFIALRKAEGCDWVVTMLIYMYPPNHRLGVFRVLTFEGLGAVGPTYVG